MVDWKCENYWALADYMPVDAALDYWCGNKPGCRNAKEFAIIAACEAGEIKYSRADGKTFDDPVQDLMARGILLIHRESFKEWADKIEIGNKPDLPLDSRSEMTYLNIIGALLDIFVSRSFGDVKFKSETELREFIGQKYKGFKGLSERTLGDKFAAAKRRIKEED